jgi:hypothetical protein
VTSDPRLDLLGLINGFQITQAIHVASTLRVADHLNGGARSAGELAALTKSHPDSLYRLLRALAAVGVFPGGRRPNVYAHLHGGLFAYGLRDAARGVG